MGQVWIWQVILIVACLSVHTSGDKWIPSVVGPWRAIIRTFERCPGSNNTKDRIFFNYHLNRYKPNELQRWTGNATYNAPYNDSCGLLLVLDLWNNNQWKSNAFIMPFQKNSCTLFNRYSNFLPEILHIYIKPPQPCVIPVGIYPLNDEPVDIKIPALMATPYGRYRFTLTVTDQLGDRMACIMGIVDSVPKLDKT